METLAPVEATWRVSMRRGEVRREDVWSYRLVSAQQGRITHRMDWEGPVVGRRSEREELAMQDGRVRARTLGPDFREWPDDTRWRWALERPSADWAGLDGILRVEADRSDPATSAVLERRGEGSRDGWHITAAYSVSRGAEVP